VDPLRLLQRAFDLVRYGNDLAARSAQELAQLRASMVAALGAATPTRRAAIARVLRQWQESSTDTYNSLAATLRAELPELASAYRVQAGQDVGRTVGAREPIPDVVGLPADRWVAEQRRSLAIRSEAQLRLAASANEPVEAVAARIDRVLAQRQREMATLMRTAVVRTAATAYQAGLEAAGVEEYRYIAVLDNRTTRSNVTNDPNPVYADGCFGLSGRLFSFADPQHPMPGWHWNCRSHIEPVTDTVEEGGFGVEALRKAGISVEGVRAAGLELQRKGVMVGRGATGAGPNLKLMEQIRNAPTGVRVDVLGGPGARRIGLGLSLGEAARRETTTMSLADLRARL
jgi:SPP1 gp7 family putative phage head morphogenesis protein